MSYESRISSQLTSELHDNRIEQLKKHKKIINEIEPQKEKGATNSFYTNPDKVARQQNVGQTQNNTVEQFYKPIFKWEKTDDTTQFHIIPTEKSVEFKSLYNMNGTSNQLLSLLGYKIDISQQVDQFKQKFQKCFIESKSHNALIGKFSELKVGIIGAMLSLLGLKPNDIDELKHDALKKAIADNINSFEQNEYNAELITVFTKTKKIRVGSKY